MPLGAFGKYGRGVRPLIFSTELARSTSEFTVIPDIVEKFMKAKQAFEDAKTPEEKAKAKMALEKRHQSNVAVYGMITVRSDGNKTIIAQKLERPGGKGEKWDIYELTFNADKNQFEFDPGH